MELEWKRPYPGLLSGHPYRVSGLARASTTRSGQSFSTGRVCRVGWLPPGACREELRTVIQRLDGACRSLEFWVVQNGVGGRGAGDGKEKRAERGSEAAKMRSKGPATRFSPRLSSIARLGRVRLSASVDRNSR